MNSKRIMLVVSLLLASRVLAAPPKVETLIESMRAVVWPAKPSYRKLTITITPDKAAQAAGQGSAPTQWLAGQAREQAAGGGWMVTVLEAPPDARGIAWLVQEGPKETVQWLWNPTIGRVRKLIPLEGHQAFLGSDFTYSDLGLVDLHSTYKLVGEEQHGGVTAYKIEEVPRSNWYYARIVTWIDAATSFPIERQFFDPTNTLWKVETFEQVTDINGVPTVLRMRMEDRQAGGSTTIDVSGVRYGADVADELFDPAKLPQAINSPVWK